MGGSHSERQEMQWFKVCHCSSFSAKTPDLIIFLIWQPKDLLSLRNIQRISSQAQTGYERVALPKWAAAWRESTLTAARKCSPNRRRFLKQSRSLFVLDPSSPTALADTNVTGSKPSNAVLTDQSAKPMKQIQMICAGIFLTANVRWQLLTQRSLLWSLFAQNFNPPAHICSEWISPKYSAANYLFDA